MLLLCYILWSLLWSCFGFFFFFLRGVRWDIFTIISKFYNWSDEDPTYGKKMWKYSYIWSRWILKWYNVTVNQGFSTNFFCWPSRTQVWVDIEGSAHPSIGIWLCVSTSGKSKKNASNSVNQFGTLNFFSLLRGTPPSDTPVPMGAKVMSDLNFDAFS